MRDASALTTREWRALQNTVKLCDLANRNRNAQQDRTGAMMRSKIQVPRNSATVCPSSTPVLPPLLAECRMQDVGARSEEDKRDYIEQGVHMALIDRSQC